LLLDHGRHRLGRDDCLPRRVDGGGIDGAGRGELGQAAEGDDLPAVLRQPGQRDAMLRWEFQKGLLVGGIPVRNARETTLQGTSGLVERGSGGAADVAKAIIKRFIAMA
jgi:hypothetical protein